MLFIFIIFVIIAYLLGSLSSAIIFCKLTGLPDPRTQGSKNPGATNVLRIGGKKAAVIVLIGDVLKGFIPVLLAKFVGISHGALALVALAAFMGHLFPLFFHFRGGKGVATAFGCVLALSFTVGLLLTAIWLITACVFRYSSLAALIAAFASPFFIYAFSDTAYVIPVAIMSILVIIRHHENIKNLMQGQEGKIDQ